MEKSRSFKTDRQRFMAALTKTCGSPRVKYHHIKGASSWEAIETIEQWWCPSCRTPKALILEYPEWLRYPKPWCTDGCPDVEVYRELGLEELAFRGDSPPLVECYAAQAYFRRKRIWPELGSGERQWRGSCRKCDGCRQFAATRQAYELSESWSRSLSELARSMQSAAVWAIEIVESDLRRVLDALRYHAIGSGGAIAQVPTQEGRLLIAVLGTDGSGRASPIHQRLVRDGLHLRDRPREPTDRYSWTAIVSVEEQVARLLFGALIDRVWDRDGVQVRLSYVEYSVEPTPDA